MSQVLVVPEHTDFLDVLCQLNLDTLGSYPIVLKPFVIKQWASVAHL